MNKEVFVPELNVWNNKILTDPLNVNKTFLKISALTQAYYNEFIDVESLQSVIFGNTYESNRFGLFYTIEDLCEDYPEMGKRVKLYSDLKTYYFDAELLEPIPIPFDSTSWDSSSYISARVIPDQINPLVLKPSYNVFQITYEEYYYLDQVKKYKNGESINITYNLTQSKLSELLLQYLMSELAYTLPTTLPLLTEEDRLLDWLFYHWMTNYFYNRKRLCDVQRMSSETHFYIPTPISKIFTITDQELLNGYVLLDYEPVNSAHVLVYHKNVLYTNNNYMIVSNERRLYWDTTIPMESGNKLYVEYSSIPFELLQVI